MANRADAMQILSGVYKSAWKGSITHLANQILFEFQKSVLFSLYFFMSFSLKVTHLQILVLSCLPKDWHIFLTKLHYYMCIQILLKSQMIYWKQLWFTWDCRLNIIFANCLLLEIRKWRQDNDNTYVENWNSIHIYYSQMVLFGGFSHKHTFFLLITCFEEIFL